MNNEIKMKVISNNQINMKLSDSKSIDMNVSSTGKEVDPIFRDSPAYTITYNDINYWNNKSDFTGYYNDLKDKPNIPNRTSELVNDAGFITKTVNNLTNYTLSANLSSVATSGDYDDLTNKPTIPTKTSDLDNDSGFINNTVNDLTNYTLTSSLATVATTGDYSDLLNTPTLATVATSGLYNDLLNKPTLATVASTGDYDDLINKPSIPTVPTDVSAFNNDAGYITNTVNDLTNYTLSSNLATVATSGSYSDLSNTPNIPVVDSSISTSSTNAIENGAITTALKDLIKIETETINVGNINGGTAKYNQSYTLTNIPAGYKFVGIVGWNLQGTGFTDLFIPQLVKETDTSIKWSVKSTLSYAVSPTLYVDVICIKVI